MKQQKLSIAKRLKSFKHAANGLAIFFREEHNARVHLLMAMCFVIAGFYFHITHLEWIAIVMSIGFVIGMEALNSAIESLADYVCPERDDMIKKVKDLSAASVLLAAISALVVGIIVFAPRLMELI